MYILVNEKNVIVGSAVNMPSETCCSKNKQKIYHIPNDEYDPSMIGASLVSYDKVEVVKSGGKNA